MYYIEMDIQLFWSRVRIEYSYMLFLQKRRSIQCQPVRVKAFFCLSVFVLISKLYALMRNSNYRYINNSLINERCFLSVSLQSKHFYNGFQKWCQQSLNKEVNQFPLVPKHVIWCRFNKWSLLQSFLIHFYHMKCTKFLYQVNTNTWTTWYESFLHELPSIQNAFHIEFSTLLHYFQSNTRDDAMKFLSL